MLLLLGGANPSENEAVAATTSRRIEFILMNTKSEVSDERRGVFNGIPQSRK